ncbi:hypothetical protein AKO1_004401, partial [Acrasis kona]
MDLMLIRLVIHDLLKSTPIATDEEKEQEEQVVVTNHDIHVQTIPEVHIHHNDQSTSPIPSPPSPPPIILHDVQVNTDHRDPIQLSSINTQTSFQLPSPPVLQPITTTSQSIQTATTNQSDENQGRMIPHYFLLSDLSTTNGNQQDYYSISNATVSYQPFVVNQQQEEEELSPPPSPVHVITSYTQTLNPTHEIQVQATTSNQQVFTQTSNQFNKAHDVNIQTGSSLNYKSPTPSPPSPVIEQEVINPPSPPPPVISSPPPPSSPSPSSTGHSSKVPDDENYTTYKQLFPYLHESEIEKKLRFEIMQGVPKRNYFYRDDDELDSVSTRSSLDTFSTLSSNQNQHQLQEAFGDDDVGLQLSRDGGDRIGRRWGHEVLQDANYMNSMLSSNSVFDWMCDDEDDGELIKSYIVSDDDEDEYSGHDISYGELMTGGKNISNKYYEYGGDYDVSSGDSSGDYSV